MSSKYEYGRSKEKKVEKSLIRKGGKSSLSKRSRGAADMKVTFPSGTKWYIQVKSSKKGTPASPSRKDIGRLKSSASKNRATPVIAKVSKNKISYEYARTGRKATFPQRKK